VLPSWTHDRREAGAARVRRGCEELPPRVGAEAEDAPVVASEQRVVRTAADLGGK
jgi:hypothetical protein